jgi:hypothetical protein
MLENASSMVQHWQASITAAATNMHTYDFCLKNFFKKNKF